MNCDFPLVQNAISVIETDCEVDFAPPLDYVEPKREEPLAPARTTDGAGARMHSQHPLSRSSSSFAA